MLTPSNSLKILLIERNKELCRTISQYLCSQGYKIFSVTNFEDGFKNIQTNEYLILIIDCDFQRNEDRYFLSEIKHHNASIPILIIGEKKESLEILSYSLGANIYHNKPIRFKLLCAQIEQLLSFFKQKVTLELDDIQIDVSTRTFRVGKDKVNLTYNEFCLILFLVRAEGGVVNRETIVTHIFNCNKNISYAAVDTMISRIRKKLSLDITKPFIQTVYNCGYRINPNYFDNLKVHSSKR